MKNYSVLPMLGLLVGLSGCDRLSLQDSSKVRIQFPSAQSLTSKAEAFVTSGGTTPDGRPIPTGFTGSAPINCYLVTVTGPEEALRRNTCARDDNSAPARNVGPWTGGVPAGGELTMEVPSGDSREFLVIGFYAPDGQCKDFKSAGFGDGLSRPYVLGSKAGMKLRAGETTVVDIPITYDSEKWFDSCRGPDFPEDGPSNPGASIPTRITSSKDWFPANTYVLGACTSVGVFLSDDQNRHGVLPTDTQFSLSLNGTQVGIYQSYDECHQMLGTSPTSTIAAGQNFKDVVFRAPDTPGPLEISITNVSSAVVLQAQTKTYQIVDSGLKGVELQGARSILPDLCYPFKLTRRYIDAGNSPDNAMSPGVVTLAPGAGLSVYSTSDCSGAAQTSITIPSYTSSTAVWVKSTGTAGQNSITLSGASFVSLTQNIYRGGGTNTPSKLELRGHSDGPTRDFCYNSPFEAILVNDQHTAVLAPSPLEIQFTSSSAEYFSDSACSYPVSSVSLAAGQYSVPFFLKARTPQALTLGVSSSLTQAGSYTINVRGPFANGSENVFVSGFNGVCAKSMMGSFCWGNPSGGRLGYPVSTQQNIPKHIAPAGTDWSYVKMGYDFSCGLSHAGEVKCWGMNTKGQLGDGTTSLHDLPAPVTGGDYFINLSVANSSACAITTMGVLKCWGDNISGNLGDGTTVFKTSPTTIDAGVTYNQISAGSSHTCGITNTGQLKCWGTNTYGKLGTGNVTNYNTPTAIDVGTTYSMVSVGSTHTCAVTTSGILKCWGGADFGAVGNGVASGSVTTPTVIDSGTSYMQISAGEQMTCGVTQAGAIKCWGLNTNGRLGVGTMTSAVSVPTQVNMPAEALPASVISTGSGTTCAISNGGKLWCWGEGQEGELGVNNPTDSSTPQPLIY